MKLMKYTEVAELPTVVDIVTAARALGLSRSHAYELAKRDAFPCRVIRVGTRYRVPTACLLRLIEVEEVSPD
ncbi:helix-turn-helix domain-containing protein [Actinomadura madurae]|uniref:helix-turn-helix domain-containing protein n=1 Tax=Actinomadura madurae TaxID=1993 RepID=UPI002026DA14|nr:helix-turn-helix domain-containing protein [Actinomadura madurae]URM97347.1 helix-turn-helix domain-containing protein [Actinomadura madurae]